MRREREELRTFTDEARAAEWWLESREPRRRSPSDPDPRRIVDGGTSHVAWDAEATLRAIDEACAELAPHYAGPVLVHLGWRVSFARLQRQPGIELGRAELDARLPASFTRRGLDAQCRAFRRACVARRLVDPSEAEMREQLETGTPEPRVLAREEMLAWRGEYPLRGWKAIAQALGMSERQARRMGEVGGLPVHRPAGEGASVFAYGSELAGWVRRQGQGEG